MLYYTLHVCLLWSGGGTRVGHASGGNNIVCNLFIFCFILSAFIFLSATCLLPSRLLSTAADSGWLSNMSSKLFSFILRFHSFHFLFLYRFWISLTLVSKRKQLNRSDFQFGNSRSSEFEKVCSVRLSVEIVRFFCIFHDYVRTIKQNCQFFLKICPKK